MSDRTRLLLRVAFSLVAASLIWWSTRAIYEPLLARIGDTILAATEKTSITRLTYKDGTASIHRGGLPKQQGGTLNLSYVTLNAVVLLTLLGSSAPGREEREWRRFLAASAAAIVAVFAVHVIALYVSAKALIMITEVSLGRREAGFAENFWFAAYQGYTVIGAHALAFAIWYGAIRTRRD